jgi:urease subunit gamma/beta
MATKVDQDRWTPPEPPESVIPAEAFEVSDAANVGRIDFAPGPIEINAGRECKELVLINTGDRPIQIGAHYHLFEANRAMAFDREAAFGFRLDIPSGSAIRFEPGQSRKCSVVRFAGAELSMGFNDLTNGSMRSDLVRANAVRRARDQGYCFEGDRFTAGPSARESEDPAPRSATEVT